jgi:hypothetical protein
LDGSLVGNALARLFGLLNLASFRVNFPYFKLHMINTSFFGGCQILVNFGIRVNLYLGDEDFGKKAYIFRSLNQRMKDGIFPEFV